MDHRGFLVISPENDNDILQYLPPDYIVLDYIYMLEGPPLFTYHRDVTSSKTVFRTSHPTYTMIQYFYDGDFLSVSPGSHKAWTYNCPITLSGKLGTRILFDCDLLHGGVNSPNNKERIAAQYKIVHKDDVILLKHLDGVNVYKEGIGVSYFSQVCMRIMSYLLAVPIQWVFLPLLQAQYTIGIYGFLQSLIPINHYNNYKSL
ncbi:MAG: hypothetical protein EB127_15435 [Alphaproteobacteria bacterium]|nr:hypothetical protein [Alphaproteobacteria bacterium]